MKIDRWLRVKKILNQLDDVSKDRRPALLLELVGSDDELRREVEGYLEVEDEADTFLGDPLWHVLDDDAPQTITRFFETAPSLSQTSFKTPSGRFRNPFESADDVTRIGHYRLRGLLGQGGMAQVHLAVREDDYQQEVALKRVLGPVDRPQLRERFVNERQILANLQHPGIARLLDGGTDEKGFPFLVMEYVEGEPIDAYCLDHGLDLRQRLELFCQVCRAVHHAHQNLVVHRDLKPSNILVTSEGQVRLLDFGIAKLLASDEEHQLTAEGQTPMTPAYASPEQMQGEPVTTASDVYSLGVLLYLLLTDQRPYDIEGRNVAALARMICFDDPPPPSQKVTEDETEGEGRTRRRLSRMLVGDLDAIVMKAMRKEPGRRYLSAAELESDIEHYLEGSPVRAHDGNWLYHTGKYLRRNRPAVVILALIIISAFTSVALWQRAEVRRGEAEVAQRQAEAARDEAQSLTDFLTQMLRSADPEQSRGADLTIREVVDVAQQDVEIVLVDRPKTQATMYSTLSGVYDSLGLYEEGRGLAEKALEKEMSHTPDITYDLTVKISALGRSCYGFGDDGCAERNYQRALDLRRGLETVPFDHATLIFNLASVKNRLGKYDEALALHREALHLRLTTPGVDPSTPGIDPSYIGSSYYGLASVMLATEAYSKAEPLLKKALALRRQVYGDEHRRVAEVLSALGEVYLATDRAGDAADLFRQSLDMRLSTLGPQHTLVAASHKLLASAFLASDDIQRAEQEILAAIEVLQSSLTDDQDYWGLADARSVLGTIRLRQGRRQEAHQLLMESHGVLETHLGADHHRTRDAARRLLEIDAASNLD